MSDTKNSLGETDNNLDMGDEPSNQEHRSQFIPETCVRDEIERAMRDIRDETDRVMKDVKSETARTIKDLKSETVRIVKTAQCELECTAKKMNVKIIAVALGVPICLGILGFFQIHSFIPQQVDKFLREETTRETISILSNRSVRIVQALVPEMIKTNVQPTVKTLKSDFVNLVSENAKFEQFFRSNLKQNEDALQSLKSQFVIIESAIAARAGSRTAYDELRQIAMKTNSTASMAKNAVDDINDRYQQRRRAVKLGKVMLQGPNAKFEKMQLVDLVHADLKQNCEGAVNELIETCDKGMVETLVYVVQNSKHLDCVYVAIDGIQALTNRRFSALDIDGVNAWWKSATTNAVYHSGREELFGLRSEAWSWGRENMSPARIVEMLKRVDALTKKYPTLADAWRFEIYLIVWLPRELQIEDGRRELFKNAIEQYEKYGADPVEANIFKIFYLCQCGVENSIFWASVNTAIEKYSDFEVRAKNSHLFTDAFFNDLNIKWPSKRNHTRPKSIVAESTPHPDLVKRNPLTASGQTLNSENIVGYVTLKIRKGRRALLELPLNTHVPQENTLKTLGGGIDGDEISWTLNDRFYRYNYKSEHWYDEFGECVDDTHLPVGMAIIYYDRKADVETQIVISGQFDVL